jgi:hypothetical protein
MKVRMGSACRVIGISSKQYHMAVVIDESLKYILIPIIAVEAIFHQYLIRPPD